MAETDRTNLVKIAGVFGPLSEVCPGPVVYHASGDRLIAALDHLVRRFTLKSGDVVNELSRLVEATMRKTGVEIKYSQESPIAYLVTISPDGEVQRNQLENSHVVSRINMVVTRGRPMLTVETQLIAAGGARLDEIINGQIDRLTREEVEKVTSEILEILDEITE